MINPNNPRHMSRLLHAVMRSRKKQKTFRKKRYEAIQQFVGKHYSDAGAQEKLPVNMLELAVSIYRRQLVASAPKVMVTTNEREFAPVALGFELLYEDLFEELRFVDTAREVVSEAIFSIGLAKVGIAPSDTQLRGDGMLHDPGVPFVDCIQLSDWVHDMTVRRWDQAAYMGNRWTTTLSYLEDSDLYNVSDKTKGLLASMSRLGGDDSRAELIGQGLDYDDEDVAEKRVDLWDLYLPAEGLVVTLPDVGDDYLGDPLRIVEWNGPECGPYIKLDFTTVPGNTMPLPPVAMWRDMHELANRLFRKLGRQAERQKTVTGVRGDSKEDGERVQDAGDGEMITMQNPDGVRDFNYGGIDPNTLAFWLQLKDQYSYFAGNLDALAGLGPQSDTLGQDQLISAAASQRLFEMKDRTMQWVKDVSDAIGTYAYNDPVASRTFYKKLPDVDMAIRVPWTPEMREAEMKEFIIKVHPHSMQHQTPAMKLQAAERIFNTFVAPYSEMLQAQGKAPNFESLLRTVGGWANLPEIEDFITFGGPPMQPEHAGRLRQSPNTTRTQVRVNRPGANRSQKENALSQVLMGGNPQRSETNTIGRPTG